jgi:hypothetical protein
MQEMSFKSTCRGFFVASMLALVSSGALAKNEESAPPEPPAPATTVDNQVPPCSFATSKLSSEQIQNWLADPQAWLVTNPTGGVQMSNFVRSLTGSDSRTVAVLAGLTKNTATNASQRAAIGAGLARSAQAAQASDPACGAYIQETVAQLASPEAIDAFQAALSQVATEALGPAGTGGGPAGGGTGPTGGGSLTGGGTGGNTGPSGGSSTVATSSGSFSVAGGSVSDNGTTTTRTVYASPISNP